MSAFDAPEDGGAPRGMFRAPQRIQPVPHNLPSPNARPVQAQFSRGAAPADSSTLIRDPHHFAHVVDLSIAVSNNPVVAGSAAFLLEPASRRNFLALRNSSALANIYVGFGAPASLNSTFKLAPGAIILFDTVTPQDDLYALADAAGGQISFAYSNLRSAG